ncbi:MAG: glycosyltransferase [Acidobacteriia bacterium]|nr:glycosyltransferase [Terriglobia bacterium]
MAKVSVAIPTYNGEAFLSEAIQSVLSQDYRDFELLLVDDRSGDKTLDIIKSFSDSRIRFTRNEDHLGLPGNWNRCVQLAQGEYLCIFHQDDVMLPENLSKKVACLMADPELGFVHSGAGLLVDSSAPAAPVDWIEKSFEDFQSDGYEYFLKLLFHGNIVCAPTVVARRKLLLELGGFDEELSFTSDYEMWMKVCVKHPVAFISSPLVRYRWHGKNASHDFRYEKGVQEGLQAARRAVDYFIKETDRKSDGVLLRAALTGLGKVKIWAAGLTQSLSQQESENSVLKKSASDTAKILEEHRRWINELEKGKAWLDEELKRLQRGAADQEHLIKEQEHLINEKDVWIQEIEKGKEWLDDQRLSWKKMAEDLQTQLEARLIRLEKLQRLSIVGLLIAVIVIGPGLVLLLAKLLGLFK